MVGKGNLASAGTPELQSARTRDFDVHRERHTRLSTPTRAEQGDQLDLVELLGEGNRRCFAAIVRDDTMGASPLPPAGFRGPASAADADDVVIARHPRGRRGEACVVLGQLARANDGTSILRA